MLSKPIDFIAELKYRTAEEGGRRTAAFSGYRPAIKFPFSKKQTSGQQIYLNKDKVYPGETIIAEITILSDKFFSNSLSEGMCFDFREGATIIGKGKILQIINPILKKVE